MPAKTGTPPSYGVDGLGTRLATGPGTAGVTGRGATLGAMASARDIEIRVGPEPLAGVLTLPPASAGLVVFAHGSGSGRRSPRNRQVATALQARGFGTLLVDLLSPAEQRRDDLTRELRFDIELLGARVADIVAWLATQAETAALPVGLYGASTGAAAALVAAARGPLAVRAVVSRGGRPDLAGDDLARVHAATLLIVGGLDATVLRLNQEALRALAGPRDLAIVPGAGHLFEEPGALDEVARLTGEFFERYLTAPLTGPPG